MRPFWRWAALASLTVLTSRAIVLFFRTSGRSYRSYETRSMEKLWKLPNAFPGITPERHSTPLPGNGNFLLYNVPYFAPTNLAIDEFKHITIMKGQITVSYHQISYPKTFIKLWNLRHIWTKKLKLAFFQPCCVSSKSSVEGLMFTTMTVFPAAGPCTNTHEQQWPIFVESPSIHYKRFHKKTQKRTRAYHAHLQMILEQVSQLRLPEGHTSLRLVLA